MTAKPSKTEQRLAEAGYLARTERHPHWREYFKDGIWYWPTSKGLAWWIAERAKLVEGKCWLSHEHDEWCRRPAVKYRSDLSILDPNNNEPYTIADMAPQIEGKGIGCNIDFFVRFYPTIWAAMRDGLLTFVAHRDYSGAPHNNEEYVTAALTKEGMAYFDSLPRLELECA